MAAPLKAARFPRFAAAARLTRQRSTLRPADLKRWLAAVFAACLFEASAAAHGQTLGRDLDAPPRPGLSCAR